MSFTYISCHNLWTLVTYNSEILSYAAIAIRKFGLLECYVPSSATHILTMVRLHSLRLVGRTKSAVEKNAL